MNDEHQRIAAEVSAYCQDAIALTQCNEWGDLEAWLVEAGTEPWHEYENLTQLKQEAGADMEAVKSLLLIEYIASNIAHHYIGFRNALEYEQLERDRVSGSIDQQQFDKDSKELARAHARLYGHLNL